MPFTIRPYRRFPIYCPVTYQTGLFEGHGAVWSSFQAGGHHRLVRLCRLTIT
jgi:hypothetical protein